MAWHQNKEESDEEADPVVAVVKGEREWAEGGEGEEGDWNVVRDEQSWDNPIKITGKCIKRNPGTTEL